MGGSGLCHSDEHVVTGDLPWPIPMIGGHEGAGTILETGPGVEGLAPGDRVIFGFIPACGRCSACSAGMQNLCELGQYLGDGTQISDHTARHHARGQDIGLMCLLGTFAAHTVVNEANCIKIEDDIALDKACLLGCGVVTGWGSAVFAGGVKPGDTYGRHRRRRYRDQRGPRRRPERFAVCRGRGPGRVQAGEGPGVRRHACGGNQRRGAGAGRRTHLGARRERRGQHHGSRRRASRSGRAWPWPPNAAPWW